MRRLFIGCTIPAVIDDLLETAAKKLAEDCRRLKPVRAEHRHLTLRFLGEVQEDDFLKIRDFFATLSPSDFGVFEISLDGYGHFTGRDGLTVFADVRPSPALYALVRAYEEGLLRLGFAPERRPFKPHITLARKAVFFNRADYRAYPLHEEPLPIPEVVLWQSRLSSAGPSYEALVSMRLSN